VIQRFIHVTKKKQQIKNKLKPSRLHISLLIYNIKKQKMKKKETANS